MAKKRISTLKKLLRAFQQGATITAACKSAGISDSIYFRWCREWPNLRKRVDQIMQCRTQYVIDSVYKNAVNGKEASQKLWLINRGGWRGGDGLNVAVNNNNANVIEGDAVVIPVTADEKEQAIAYARLIKGHNLIGRVLGPEGDQPILGDGVEGQQRLESNAGGNPPGDTVAH